MDDNGCKSANVTMEGDTTTRLRCMCLDEGRYIHTEEAMARWIVVIMEQDNMGTSTIK